MCYNLIVTVLKYCNNHFPPHLYAECMRQNAICHAVRHAILVARRAAEELVDRLRIVLDAANAALIPLQKAVDAAKAAVDAAEAILEDLKVTPKFATALQAAAAIAKFGLNGLISIREISFSAGLDVAASGSFSGLVRAVFAGAPEATVSFNINLYDITSMAKQLADHIVDGFSSLF